MNCQETDRLRELYTTGELGQERASELAAHLTNCPGCARRYAETNRLDDHIRRSVLAMDIDSGPVERQVRLAISAKKSTGSRRARVLGAAVAALLVLAAGVGLTLQAQRERTAGAFFAAAERDHRLEIIEGQPRRWLTETAAMERLAAGQGVAASKLSALVPPDYAIVQAKVCRLNGQLFLHLVLARRAGHVSVYLRQSASRYRLTRTADAAGFADGQFTALVVADDSATAADIARTVSRVI